MYVTMYVCMLYVCTYDEVGVVYTCVYGSKVEEEV